MNLLAKIPVPCSRKIVIVLTCIASAHAGCVPDARNRHLTAAFGVHDLHVACSLPMKQGWSHLDREPSAAEEMIKIVKKRVDEARSEGRRRHEWFSNVDGQVALCVTWPRPNFCFTDVLNFAVKEGKWVNIDELDEIADVLCTTRMPQNLPASHRVASHLVGAQP